MRRLAKAIDGLDEPAVEKIAEGPAGGSLPGPHRDDAVGADEGCGDRRRVARACSAWRARRGRWRSCRSREIEELIYPVSFYRNKAVHVSETCQQILTRFGGVVPSTMEELLTLPGVGRKTANLVLILAHRSADNICVDTHVHRISNRLGWVTTRTPEETEQALYARRERRWWPVINLYLVTWGQNVCRPVYPLCPQLRARGPLSENRRHEGGEA